MNKLRVLLAAGDSYVFGPVAYKVLLLDSEQYGQYDKYNKPDELKELLLANDDVSEFIENWKEHSEYVDVFIMDLETDEVSVQDCAVRIMLVDEFNLDEPDPIVVG